MPQTLTLLYSWPTTVVKTPLIDIDHKSWAKRIFVKHVTGTVGNCVLMVGLYMGRIDVTDKGFPAIYL